MEPINILANQRHVGCLGGGQLGRMMAQAASRLGVIMTTLDPGGLDSPMGAVCGKAVTGSFTDPVKIRELAKLVDVVTVEIEHVDAVVLAELEAEGIAVHPSGKTIMLIQDKYAQKIHLSKLGGAVPLGDFCEIPDVAALLSAGERWGYPIMLKAKKNAYDGRGNLPVGSAVEAASAFATLSNNGKEELYAERWCLFTKELAVMVARSASGVTVSYPVVEMTAIDSQLHTVLSGEHRRGGARFGVEDSVRRHRVALGWRHLRRRALPDAGWFRLAQRDRASPAQLRPLYHGQLPHRPV